MKAVVGRSYGSPDLLTLEDVDRPAVGPGDVLVRVRAAGLDQGIWHTVTGLPCWPAARGVTLFMVLLGGFKALLARYSGQLDLVVGVPLAGRIDSRNEDLVGFLVNALPLRTQVDPSAGPTHSIKIINSANDCVDHPRPRLPVRSSP